jgi:magnesium transporter
LIENSTKIYLRDVYENLIQVVDVVETYRDILSGMLDVYLSSVSNRTNAVMKVLTIITTIFMPISFLAGFFGMNFAYLPGLNSIYGPIYLSLFMGIIFIGMLYYFKNKKWL